jgi:hypothetical protein
VYAATVVKNIGCVLLVVCPADTAAQMSIQHVISATECFDDDRRIMQPDV